MDRNVKHRLSKLFSILAIISLHACSGGGDEPIIIGTGMQLEGTATSNKQFASNSIQARARSGELSTASINSQGRFSFDITAGSGPWLLRVDLGNNNYLYGVAPNTSAELLVQNVHSYSDAVVRNWYQTQNLDIDAEFDSPSSNESTPSSTATNAISDRLLSLVADVTDVYNVSNVDLNTFPFIADGTGVDKFILQNPVIHNDGTITINVFDPLNNTASVAVKELNLSTDLTVPDTSIPSAPTELRALPSASDEITLVWQVADDNIGIARYAIFRNGQPLGTSPYPVFVDGGLTGGIQYNYSVVAIDASGNESAAAMANASPLQDVDTTAPPTPSRVTIDTRRNSLDLDWSISNVNDVATFAISRGTSPSDVMTFVNVNSNFYFDDAVNPGVEYCYRISAVDASGNASQPTGVSCATAPGANASSEATVAPENNSNVTTPPAETIVIERALTAPEIDVSDTPCTTEFPGSFINTDTTLSEGCYLATDDISISEPANLTLEPGVIIKFYAGRELTISKGASLTARGTQNNPIVLTGLEATPGHWNGVWFKSTSAKNELDHVQIEYAGDAARGVGGVHFSAGAGDARLSMSNSTVRFNAGPGMSIRKNIAFSTFDGNRYTGNAFPVHTLAAHVALLDKRSVYTGNALDAITVPRINMYADMTWPALDAPYHTGGMEIYDGVFTAEAGAKLLFTDGAEISVSPDGSIIMPGTSENPITLSGVDGQSGSWSGIRLFSSESNNQMRYVTLEHAGQNSDYNAALTLGGGVRGSARMALDNVTIRDSMGWGINARVGTVFTEFNNVTITGNDGVAIVTAYGAQIFNNAGSFTGNTTDAIAIRESSFSNSIITLSNTDIPYHVDSITANNSLILEAGVSFLMKANAKLFVSAGYWEGIDIRNSNSLLNRMTHTLVADGASNTNANFAGSNISLFGSFVIPSQLSIESSRIENSAGYGITTVGGEYSVLNMDANTSFIGNALGDTNLN